jgi:cytidine deaminase
MDTFTDISHILKDYVTNKMYITKVELDEIFIKVGIKTLTLDRLKHMIVNNIGFLCKVPISNFEAAALIESENNNLYFGVNIEFIGCVLSNTIHAEQFAITNSFLNGEKRVLSIYTNAYPCGHCRQFLYEIADECLVTICRKVNNNIVVDKCPLSNLLPYGFDNVSLNIKERLFDGIKCNYRSEKGKLQAIDFVESSYAPISKSKSALWRNIH